MATSGTTNGVSRKIWITSSSCRSAVLWPILEQLANAPPSAPGELVERFVTPRRAHTGVSDGGPRLSGVK